MTYELYSQKNVIFVFIVITRSSIYYAAFKRLNLKTIIIRIMADFSNKKIYKWIAELLFRITISWFLNQGQYKAR